MSAVSPESPCECPPQEARTMNRPSGSRPLRYADRKSTRLNSSHLGISYAVFCLKKSAPSLRAQQEVTRITGVPEWYVGSQPPALQRFMGPRAECRSLSFFLFRRASQRDFIFSPSRAFPF